MSIFSMFSTEDNEPTIEIEHARFYQGSAGDAKDYSNLELRFYNIGDLGYCLSLVDSDGDNVCDLILTKDQMTNLVVKAEIVQA